ncbi:hypothetical protein V6N12_045872 [Hibiscus sabdariffa]|uniref:Uncharacterized protein n=1 Tax=Hibiscus sabdariffa TaxID=183260 RepID=A0ABR2G4H2_9ROSI
MAKARTRKRAIQPLQLVESEWCTDHERLRTAATSAFASMFDVDDAPLPPFPFASFFPPIAETTSASLTMLPQEA